MTHQARSRSAPMTEATSRIRLWSEEFEGKLEQCLNSHHGTPDRLQRAMTYSVLAGGKRMRPLLVYAACEALEVAPSQLDAVACAIEIIHTYSLIHDDLPTMDDDDLRRGIPTCHKAFDEATAILAGDALQALAFEILARDSKLASNPAGQLKIISEIASACGSSGMAGGQALDLAAVGQKLCDEELTHMHRLKTGALIKVSATSPAHFISSAPELVAKLNTFGECVGLAFQIHDDVLDVTGTVEKTGKSTQKDARQEKPTFPGLLGLDGSKKRANGLRDQAIAALDGFPGDCSALGWLATYAVDRDS